MATDLKILIKTYDLILWTLNHTRKFPRDHRHSLGIRMEDRLYGLLEDLVEAGHQALQTQDATPAVPLRIEPSLASAAEASHRQLDGPREPGRHASPAGTAAGRIPVSARGRG